MTIKYDIMTFICCRFLYYWHSGRWLIGEDYNVTIVGIESRYATGPVSPVSIRGWEYYEDDWVRDDSLLIAPAPPEGQAFKSELVI